MKVRFVFFLFVLCSFGCKRHQSVALNENSAQILIISDSASDNYNNITERDRHNYILTAELLRADTDSCFAKKTVAYTLSVVLNNNSNDTLKFIDFTCSHFIWFTDNKLISAIAGESACFGCDSNLLGYSEVPPHRAGKYQLLAEFNSGTNPMKINFKVGMILQRVLKPDDMMFYDKHYEDGNKSGNLRNQTQNLIWSNIIQTPD